eukprot:superscaffoldBa00000177_g2435
MGAVAAVCEVSQRIQNNTRRHENHLQLCRVQKLLKGRKTKVLAAERWYIREGWLKMVPPKGAEAKPKMFFLFSDMLLQAKRCSPLHPTNGDKFTGQFTYPLQDCTVEKVFGHTRSQGGLLSLTFPKAKLLLMSSNQEDLNDWYQSLSSAVRQPLSVDQLDLRNCTPSSPEEGPGQPRYVEGPAMLRALTPVKLQSKQTVVHQRDELSRRPLRSAANSHNAPSSSSSNNNPSRKRNMENTEPSEHAQMPAVEWESSAPKRMKQSGASGQSSEVSTSSCVIL